MQQKGVVKFFAIVFILVCVFQLSFTLVSYLQQNKAERYSVSPVVDETAKKMAKGNPLRQEFLYDSISKSRMEY